MQAQSSVLTSDQPAPVRSRGPTHDLERTAVSPGPPLRLHDRPEGPAAPGSARRGAVALAVLTLTALLCAPHSVRAQAPSEEAYTYFEQNCVSCHTIGGGKLAGPDLKGLFERQERAWLVDYLLDPKAVIDSGDAYAQALLREARGAYMPKPPRITRELAEKILRVIEVESAEEKSRFAGLQISDRPLTAADVALGRQLFRGQAPFESGAPACFACHTLHGAGAFGGGQLGPDLTAVYSRLEGRAPLAAWLSAPPSEVMAPVFRPTPLNEDEVLALTAYLKHTAESGMEAASSGTLAFLLTGFGLAAVLLVLCDVIWRKRYQATRRPMVERRLTHQTLVEGRLS